MISNKGAVIIKANDLLVNRHCKLRDDFKAVKYGS